MRFLILLFFAGSVLGQSSPHIQFSHTTESLRGVSAVSREVAWASGTRGTYLRTTDGGRIWTPAQVPDASGLDFRGVVAFSADEAFLMSSGPGEQSRIYHTSDGGQHWQLQFKNSNPKGFFDSIAFWNPTHGVVVGDPVADEGGKLHFEVLMTEDGQTWRAIPGAQLPEAKEGEGAFAASNSCIVLDESRNGGSAPGDHDENIWFATGGKVARVFHSGDDGKTWEVYDTPIMQGQDSSGIFSIAFRNAQDGVIAGGDYKRPRDDGPNLAFTHDGGKTWELATIHPLAYFSAIAYDRAVEAEARREAKADSKKRVKPQLPERMFLVGQDFVFDFRPPVNPRRLNTKGLRFNAVSAFPEGGGLVVGPKGTIVMLP